MNKLKLFVAALVTVSGLLISVPVANAANDDKCEVRSISYSVGAETVTANFEVYKVNPSEDVDCTKDVTIASWNAPNGINGMPFNKQTIVDSVSDTYEVGVHSVSVKKPECFYQVDVIRGLDPKGPDGTANYTAAQYVSSTHGGAKCEDKPEKPEKKPTKTVVVTQEALPNTGAGAVLPIAAVSGLGAGVLHNIRSRRSRK